MTNIKTDPSASGRINLLETQWEQLTWVQKKTICLKIMLVVLLTRHLKSMNNLHERVNEKIDRMVLYYIFPAHWLKDKP